MTFIPLNGHVQVEPLAHDSFIAQSKETFEEIGTVVAFDPALPAEAIAILKKGGKVYFDSWLSSKYPKDDKDFYWLVKWSDIRAYESPTKQ